MVWWGARKGRRATRASPQGSRPATECTLVASTASRRVSGGRMLGSRRASMVFPAPGGPVNKTLCAPAAATCNARFACAWPRTSARSGAGDALSPRRVAPSTAAGAIGFRPSRCRISAARHVAPITSTVPATAASRAFEAGRISPRVPRQPFAIERAPRMGRNSPLSPSSPTKAYPSTSSPLTWPATTRSASAMGRSKALPVLGTSAGARLIVSRRGGITNPALARAAVTRSRPSRTAPAGRPTIEKEGSPEVRLASTLTGKLSTPRRAAERT